MDDINDFSEGYPLVDATDHEILMHREAHFGGQFPIMLEYYRNEGKGTQPEFSIERIEQLAALEAQLQQNLAALYLEGSEAEKVAESKELYKRLRSLYEVKNSKNTHPRLIADLIFSENEEAEEEIEAIVAEKEKIVPALIEVLRNELLHDPLFPGYGMSPALVVKCLGLIGDKRAIISLFEELGQGDFFSDDQILMALKAIGDPAKQFLLKVIKGRPINEDNEKAAIALIKFKDEEVAEICFNLLKDPEVQKDLCLPTYLVLACEELKDSEKRKEFRSWANDNKISRQLREDIKAVVHSWDAKNIKE